MAILESCCFWKNVRKGSFAAGIYTLAYFSFSTLMLLFYINEERDYLFGNCSQPVGESIIVRGDVTVGIVIFNLLFLVCSVLMILASILLLYGLQSNKRRMLIPWVFLMICDLLLDFAHLIHLSFTRRVVFDPIVGFIFTIDFFIFCLNLYCLLCVISQYQEYRAQCLTAAEHHSTSLMSPIVQFRAPQKLKQSTPTKSSSSLLVSSGAMSTLSKTSLKPPKNHRQLIATNNISPLLNSQPRLTNFSTITEAEEDEEEQLQLQLQQRQRQQDDEQHKSHYQHDPNQLEHGLTSAIPMKNDLKPNGTEDGNTFNGNCGQQPMSIIIPIIRMDSHSN